MRYIYIFLINLLLGIFNFFLRYIYALCYWWCSRFSVGHISFSFICFLGLLLLVFVFALFRWLRSISVYLFPRSVIVGIRFIRFLLGLLLVGTTFFRWSCNISILVSALLYNISMHLSSRSVAIGVRWNWWCSPFSAGHVAVVFICFLGVSLLVSALFRWRYSVSIHLSSRSVTVGVPPFPLAI